MAKATNAPAHAISSIILTMAISRKPTKPMSIIPPNNRGSACLNLFFIFLILINHGEQRSYLVESCSDVFGYARVLILNY